MTTEIVKDIKTVMFSLTFLGGLVFCSYMVDKNPLDLFYLLFLVSCMIRFLVICFKS